MLQKSLCNADDGTRRGPKASWIKMAFLNIAVSLVFLFILKIKFPKETPISTIIQGRYGRRTLSDFRKYERIRQKYQKCICDIQFLVKCKSYNIIPKFLHFKLYKRKLLSSKLYREWQFKLLNIEIKSRNKDSKVLCNQVKGIRPPKIRKIRPKISKSFYCIFH